MPIAFSNAAILFLPNLLNFKFSLQNLCQNGTFVNNRKMKRGVEKKGFHSFG